MGLSVSIRERRLVVEGSIDGALLADCVWPPEISLSVSYTKDMGTNLLTACMQRAAHNSQVHS